MENKNKVHNHKTRKPINSIELLLSYYPKANTIPEDVCCCTLHLPLLFVGRNIFPYTIDKCNVI